MNKAILKGNLGADPEIKRFENGGAIAELRLATTRKYKDREGNLVDHTVWHKVKTKRSIDFIENYLKKGDSVLVEGSNENRKYEKQDGTTGYDHYVQAFTIDKLNWSSDGGGGSTSPNPTPNPSADDDLPF